MNPIYGGFGYYQTAPTAPIAQVSADLAARRAYEQEFQAYTQAMDDYNKWHDDYSNWYNATYGTNTVQTPPPPPLPPDDVNSDPRAISTLTSSNTIQGSRFSNSHAGHSLPYPNSATESHHLSGNKAAGKNNTTSKSVRGYFSPDYGSGPVSYSSQTPATSYVSGSGYGRSGEQPNVNYGRAIPQSRSENIHTAHPPAYAGALSHFAQHGLDSVPPQSRWNTNKRDNQSWGAFSSNSSKQIKPKVKKPKRKKTAEERNHKKALRLRRTIVLPGMEESDTETETESEDDDGNNKSDGSKKPVQVVPPNQSMSRGTDNSAGKVGQTASPIDDSTPVHAADANAAELYPKRAFGASFVEKEGFHEWGATDQSDKGGSSVTSTLTPDEPEDDDPKARNRNIRGCSGIINRMFGVYRPAPAEENHKSSSAPESNKTWGTSAPDPSSTWAPSGIPRNSGWVPIREKTDDSEPKVSEDPNAIMDIDGAPAQDAKEPRKSWGTSAPDPRNTWAPSGIPRNSGWVRIEKKAEEPAPEVTEDPDAIMDIDGGTSAEDVGVVDTLGGDNDNQFDTCPDQNYSSDPTYQFAFHSKGRPELPGSKNKTSRLELTRPELPGRGTTGSQKRPDLPTSTKSRWNAEQRPDLPTSSNSSLNPAQRPPNEMFHSQPFRKFGSGVPPSGLHEHQNSSFPFEQNRFVRALDGAHVDAEYNRFDELFSSHAKKKLIPAKTKLPTKDLPAGTVHDEIIGGRIKSDLVHEIMTSENPSSTAKNILQELKSSINLEKRKDIVSLLSKKVAERTEQLLTQLTEQTPPVRPSSKYPPPPPPPTRGGRGGDWPGFSGNDPYQNPYSNQHPNPRNRPDLQKPKFKRPNKPASSRWEKPTTFFAFGQTPRKKTTAALIKAMKLPPMKMTPPVEFSEAKRRKNDVELNSGNKESKEVFFNIMRTVPPFLFEHLTGAQG